MKISDMIRNVTWLTCFCVIVFSGASAAAQQVGTVPVQGYLTDAEDVAVDSTVSVVFTLYAEQAAGNPTEIWTSTRNVPVEQGLFSVLLGSETSLDLALFNDNRRVLLGIAVDGDAEMPLVELGATPYAGWAAYAASAGDAETVQGLTPAELSTEDTLEQLTCSSGDSAVFDGSAWSCQPALTAADVDQQIDARDFATNSSLAPVATSGSFGDLTGVPAGLADGDDDTLGAISCMPGQVVKQGPSGWICAEDLSGTLSTSGPLSISNETISLNNAGISTTYLADGAVVDSKVASNAAIAPTKIAGTAATLTGTQNFDSATLYVDAPANRVGVGTSSPTAALSVSGDVTSSGDVLATSFSYPAPQSKSLSVSAPVFRVPDNEDDIMSQSAFGGYAYSGSNTDTIFLAEMVAPVHLPDGATITEFRCQFYDNNSTYDLQNSSIVLRSRQFTSTTINTVATTTMSTTGSSSNVQEASDTTISATYQTVDNDTRQYWIDVTWQVPQDSVGSTTIRFYGCHVDYTVDGPT